jgi:Tol biopolymer transport system component
MFNQFSGAANFDFSENGTLVYVPYGALSFDNNLIVWMNRRGATIPLLEKPRPYFDASLSPDGQKLALTIQAANDDIWVYHIGRATLTRLTFGGGNHGGQMWTPDGKYVVYYAEKGGVPNIFRKLWDGSGNEERMTEKTGMAQFPTSFTPDGKLMVFDQGGDIMILPLDGKQRPWTFVQSPSNEYGAVLSPDGRWMAYVSNESGRDEVYAVPFPKREGKWQVSTNGGSDVRWSRNGHELFYLSGRTVMVADVIPKSTLDFSPPRKLFDLPPSAFGFFDLSPDGSRFVVGLTQAQELNITQMNVVVNWFEELKEKYSGKR